MKILKSLRSIFGTVLYWVILLSVVSVVSALVRAWFQSDRHGDDSPQEEFESAIESDGVEDILVRMVSIVEEEGFGGVEVDAYTTTDRLSTDGRNLYYYYELDPSVVNVISKIDYANTARANGLDNNCSKEFSRTLLREGVTFYHYYNISGSSERFATVSINEEDCRDYAVRD